MISRNLKQWLDLINFEYRTGNIFFLWEIGNLIYKQECKNLTNCICQKEIYIYT